MITCVTILCIADDYDEDEYYTDGDYDDDGDSQDNRGNNISDQRYTHVKGLMLN